MQLSRLDTTINERNSKHKEEGVAELINNTKVVV
jgi:hypothetical protein